MFSALALFTTVATLLQSAYAAPTFICPGAKHLAFNPACCKWYDIRDALISDVFENTCGERAHSTVRIAFHDAIGFSTTQNFGGGSDGSIIAFPAEQNYNANAGIADIVGDLQPFADSHSISYGDVIQFGSSVALSLCPGAPVVRSFVNRANATSQAPDGTIPEPTQTVQAILARMSDAGFAPAELVALLASHSIAAQDKVDETVAGAPFDTTPGTFDTQVFLEVLLKGIFTTGTGNAAGGVHSAVKGEFRIESDANIARFASTACTWQNFINQQNSMKSAFATAMGKLALLGHSSSSLLDCTEAIPAAPAFNGAAHFPPGTNITNVQQACTQTPFPSLSTAPGAATSVAPVPPQ